MLLKTHIIALLLAGIIVGSTTPGYSIEPGLSSEDKATLQQGGSAHLLLEVDSKPVIKETLYSYVEHIRQVLRHNRLGYIGLRIVNDSVQFTIISSENTESALKLIKLSYPNVVSQYENPSTLTVEIEADEKNEIIETAISNAVVIIRERFSSRLLKGSFPLVQRIENSNRIVIQFPTGFDPETLPQRIRSGSRLTLHVVDERVFENGNIPVGTNLLSFSSGKANENVSKKVIVQKRIQLVRDNFRGAEVSFNNNGNPVIHIKLDRIGFQRIQKLKGQTVAFVYNNRVLATSTIKGQFQDRTIILQGQFSLHDAQMFAEKIMLVSAPPDLIVVREWVTPSGFNNTALVGQ